MEKADLLTKKDLHDILRDVFDIAKKWYNLGLALGLVSDELDKIKVAHRDSPNECLREMIKVWLSKNSPKPTRKALISALRERTVSETSFADDLERKYMSHNLDELVAPPPCPSPSSSKGVETRQSHLPTTTARKNISSSSSHSVDSNLVKRSSESNGTPNPKRKKTDVTIKDIAAKAKISLRDLDRECSQDDLQHLSTFCKPCETVGQHLRLSTAQILDATSKTDNKPLGILKKWKEICAFKATYRVLAEALLKSQQSQRALDLCNFLRDKKVHNAKKDHYENPSQQSVNNHQKVSQGASVNNPSLMLVQSPDTSGKYTEFYNGTSYEFVSPLPEDLLCQKCHHIAFEPQQMKCCGKLCCKSCLTSGWCIKCCKPCKCSEDVRSNNQIKDLTIRCPNSKDGCSWEGRLGDVAGHRSCCHKEMVLCIYKGIGCSEVMHRDEVKEHEEEKWQVHLDYSLKKQMSMMNRIEQLEEECAEMKQQRAEQDRHLQILQKCAFPSPPNLTVTMRWSGIKDHWISQAFLYQGYLLQLVLKSVWKQIISGFSDDGNSSKEYFFTLVASGFDKNVTWPCSGTCHLEGHVRIQVKFSIKKPIGPLVSLCDISGSDQEDLVWNKTNSRIITPITKNPDNPFQLNIKRVEIYNINENR